MLGGWVVVCIKIILPSSWYRPESERERLTILGPATTLNISIQITRCFQELVSTQMLSIILTLLVSVLITHLVEKPIYKVTYHRWDAEDSSGQPKDLTNQSGIKLI